MNRLAKTSLILLTLLSTLLQTAFAADPKADPKTEKTPPARVQGGAALIKLENGRNGRGNLIALTGIRGFSKPSSASAHALIMTIGDYQGNIPKLQGVSYDSATATEIAMRMGVPAANIQTLKDGELTLEGMRRALSDLEAKLAGNDQVFIYYSGHGGRQAVIEDGAERCAESLITVDGQAFLDSEMESVLKRFSQKSQKTIVFLDACHSGGVSTRSVNLSNPAFTAKSYTPPGVSCTKASNVLTRSLNQPKPAGSGGANFVYIAAARDNEISLDQPGRGGVASQAWLACMSGAARDRDGSGGLSAEEVQVCAQERIEQQLKGATGFLPHHVSITGNPAMVLSYAAKELETPEPVNAPNATSPVAVPAPVESPASALAALNDIYNSRDDRRLVTLTTTNPILKIGSGVINMTLSSREGGYVYLLMVGSDGKTFDLLFPNQIDRNHLMEPGASMRLPRPNWQLSAEGPPGKNTLLAIVTDSPRDFNNAGLKPSGPFSAVEAVAAKDIQLVTVGASQAADAECSSPAATRNIAIRKRCSTSYGAALLTLEEVR